MYQPQGYYQELFNRAQHIFGARHAITFLAIYLDTNPRLDKFLAHLFFRGKISKRDYGYLMYIFNEHLMVKRVLCMEADFNAELTLFTRQLYQWRDLFLEIASEKKLYSMFPKGFQRYVFGFYKNYAKAKENVPLIIFSIFGFVLENLDLENAHPLYETN